MSEAEFEAFSDALNTRVTTSYELEQKIEMVLASYTKDNIPHHLLEVLFAVLLDISRMRDA